MNKKVFGKKLFQIGELSLTQAVFALVQPEWMQKDNVAASLYASNAMRGIQRMVLKHQCGFWGDVLPDCAMINEADAASGDDAQVYILSAYYFDPLKPHRTDATKDDENVTKLWIITNGAGANRYTTVLDPEWDY